MMRDLVIEDAARDAFTSILSLIDSGERLSSRAKMVLEKAAEEIRLAVNLPEDDARVRLNRAAPGLLAAAQGVLTSVHVQNYRLISPYKELFDAVEQAKGSPQ